MLYWYGIIFKSSCKTCLYGSFSEDAWPTACTDAGMVWSDVTQVSELVFELQPKPYAQTVYVDDVRATRRASPVMLEKDPDSFFPFIDRYGQYIHEDWPNKVKSDQDLVRQRIAEDRDLKQNLAPRSYNKFGGWNEGPRFEATGHFRVQKVDGKWWFIDPMGHLFWSFGCTGIGYQPARIALPGKAHFYEGLTLDDQVWGFISNEPAYRI